MHWKASGRVQKIILFIILKFPSYHGSHHLEVSLTLHDSHHHHHHHSATASSSSSGLSGFLSSVLLSIYYTLHLFSPLDDASYALGRISCERDATTKTRLQWNRNCSFFFLKKINNFYAMHCNSFHSPAFHAEAASGHC